jgi:hypothetical protein
VAVRSLLRGQLRIAVPARIALQGGERAGSVAICPCPRQEESHFGDLSGRLIQPGAAASGPAATELPAPGPEDRPRLQLPDGPKMRTLPLRRTRGGVLAKPSNHIKKRWRGQTICRPDQRFFSLGQIRLVPSRDDFVLSQVPKRERPGPTRLITKSHGHSISGC